MLLKNKTVLVTGASQGIGRALAIGLAAQGAGVGINFKNNGDGAEQTRCQIEKAGGQAELFHADVGDRPETEAMIDRFVAHFGRIDVLVNNAARTRFGPFEKVSDEDFIDVVSTNLRGTFFTSAAAVRHMKQAGSGSIINVSSCAARLMVPFHSLYTLSKGGIEALTKQLALELAPQVRVNCISPAPTSTDRNRSYDPNYDEVWGQLIPMGRVAQPQDMVGITAFLASDGAGFITGQIIQVDGGWTLKGHVPDMTNEDFSSDRNRG